MLQLERIPMKRVLVLLGKNLKTKRKIESKTGAKLKVDRSGDVEIRGDIESVLIASNIVKAIGQGFCEEEAFVLLDEKRQVHVISLQGETEKTTKRLMSRVIGREGKAKRRIEQLTDTQICVFGKTVSIIGDGEGIDRAAVAIEDLLEGRMHAYVYAKLEKMKRV